MTDTLIQRLESAEAGSHSLSEEIAVLFGYCQHKNTTYERCQGDSGRTCDDCGADSWGNQNAKGQSLYDPLPQVTVSVDDALSLIGEVLPDAVWELDRHGGEWRPGYAHQARVARPYSGKDDHEKGLPKGHAFANTPALALCAALLKAVSHDQ